MTVPYDRIGELEKAILRLERDIAAEKVKNGLQDRDIAGIRAVLSGDLPDIIKAVGIIHSRTKQPRS